MKILEGKVLCVEGLASQDDGPLEYARLARDYIDTSGPTAVTAVA